MNDFLKELPVLIITIAVLAMATALIIIGHANVSDSLAIIAAVASPAISFWFLRSAFGWQPPGTSTQSPQTDTSKPPV